MDGKHQGQHGREQPEEEWRRNLTESVERRHERPGDQFGGRMRPAHSTIRAVTPEPSVGENSTDHQYERSRNMDIPSLQTSPRSIQSRDRRQGFVFEESFDAGNSSPHQGSSPPQPPLSSFNVPSQSTSRPRTRTLEEPRRHMQPPVTLSKSRHRIGSVHSAASAGLHDEDRPSTEQSPSGGQSAAPPLRQPSQLRKSPSSRDRSGWRLGKRSSPRPSSPASSPTIDSLPVPVETANANKILKLMKTLAGRIRGQVDYQTSPHGAWASGICYIDDSKGALMYEGEDRGPFHQTLILDLRGCRVRPILSLDKSVKCLEITTIANSKLQLLPSVSPDFDQWLAALLYWEQIRPGTSHIDLTEPESVPSSALSRSSSFNPLKDAAIIKVGKLLLWDKGAPLSSTSILRKAAVRDARPGKRLWRRVSCILQDNGEFKLLTENDVTLLSVIQLSQLSRCAVQQLDRSVLNEEYCIAIFPQYTSTSTSISIIRPVFIALESRVLFEVWFVLLRAFAIPEIYGPNFMSEESDDDSRVSDSYTVLHDMFRIEKSMQIRVIEAKMRHVIKNESQTKHSSKVDLEQVTGDYLAEVVLDGEVRSRTMAKKDTKNPFWREETEFQDLPATLPELSVIVKRVESVAGPPGPNSRSSAGIHFDPAAETVCGTVNVRLDELDRGTDSESWQPILDENQETVGEIFLKIRRDETVVLMAKDYRALSELLHRFTSGLTIQMAHVIPSKLKFLSERLINIFQVSGQATQWLMALIEDEIDGIAREVPHTRFRFSRRVGSNDSFDSNSERELTVRDMGKSLTGEANLLFRGNSILTQALDFHMRRLGKEYLEDVLLEKIVEIDSLNPNCEVDPSRLASGDEISKNWSQLISLTTGVWDTISLSAKKCPTELRQILKFIRAVADDRYGDFLKTVPYTSVSGFLFLRFFCPAILNPKLFGLLRDHPQPKAQRTLTLIAKSLQVLANLSTFGQKEEWMEPMNKFLSSHRQGVKKFIDDVCDIPSERGSFALPASYSTPMTILGRLPPTSREGFPSLPYLIDHARNFAALIKLWLDSTDNFHSPHLFDGDLLQFHELCQSLQRKTDECVRKAEQADKGDDDLNLHWDDVTNPLEKFQLTPLNIPSTVIDPEITAYSSRQSQSTAATSSSRVSNGRQASVTQRSGSRDRENLPPSSAGSDTGSKERKERQSFWETTFGKDSKYQRPFEPEEAGSALVLSASPPGKSGKGKTGFLIGLRKKDAKERKDSKGDTWAMGMIGNADSRKDKEEKREGAEKEGRGDRWAMGMIGNSADGKSRRDRGGAESDGSVTRLESSWTDNAM